MLADWGILCQLAIPFQKMYIAYVAIGQDKDIVKMKKRLEKEEECLWRKRY